MLHSETTSKAVIFGTFSFAIVLLVWIGQTSSVSATGPQNKNHIRRIERGLLPAAIIKGQPSPAMLLDDRMKYYHVPGVSIAFFDHGKVQWARGYGFADVENKRPVSPDTLFQAASISKSVTAVGALRLVRDGKLKLDEDVNEEFTSWKVSENEFTRTEKVTLRRLLSHTAGMTVGGFAGYREGEPLPTVVQILNGEKPANSEAIRVDQTPGKGFRYSGGGYVAAQLLIMDVTGKSFPRLMRELVFHPLGMTHSTFEEPLPQSLRPNAARPYDTYGNPVEGGWRVDPEMAPAGLWTTPTDLARMAIEIQNAYTGKSDKIISSTLAHEMLAYGSAQVYGLGVALAARGQAPRFWHSGANAGYKAQFVAFAESGEGVAIMTNGDAGLNLIGEIQRGVAQEYGWADLQPESHSVVKLDPAKIGRYTGVFLFGGQFEFTITQKDGRLYLQYAAMGEEPRELLAESETRLFVPSAPYVIDFAVEADGSIHKAEVRSGPEHYSGERVSAKP
jgi:CubicO group peptidase (beta-lactamase class C family)